MDLTKVIVRQLEDKILEYEGEVHNSALAIAELDCLLSFANCARDYNYTRPKMVTDSVCYIKKGRHPLQELCVEAYIANDVVVCNIFLLCLCINLFKFFVFFTTMNSSLQGGREQLIWLLVLTARVNRFT